ncbi:MAG: hypothetical protein DMF90_25665 [Acidobacteria bacterium]|nr:MAG: hypothetical protein DMF90_25665 [Acidobacteriota bacterium]
MRRTDHFDGQRFFNPAGLRCSPFSAVPRLLLSMRRPRWPSRIEQQPVAVPARDSANVVLTFIGHATFLVQASAARTSVLAPFGIVVAQTEPGRRQDRIAKKGWVYARAIGPGS